MNNYSKNMNKLSVHNLYKSYSHQAVLENISFAAQSGEVIALLGCSGSGKSTLLRCLNLLTLPERGRIQIDDQAFLFSSEKKFTASSQAIIRLRKRVGMVFQQYNLWSHMTLLQNLIEAPIHVLKQNKDSTIVEAEVLLEKVGLSKKQHYYPTQLSGGEQQRGAIARALMMKPEVMLFDEPTSALDPEMVGEVLLVMQELAVSGMTMLVATHELNFAKRVTSRLLFLDQGQIVEQGDTIVMFRQPETARFRRFLEAMAY